jgi:hypothetical protein
VKNGLHQPATGGRREDETTAIDRKVRRSGARADLFRDVGKLSKAPRSGIGGDDSMVRRVSTRATQAKTR